nr:putative ribonuclease H-like domain-containing protein [Tanacetum cinerariifolium]
MFDCDDYHSSGSDDSLSPSPIYDRYQSGNGYHLVLPLYKGTFRPPKPDLVFNNAPNDVETDHPTFNVKLSPTKPNNDLSHTHRPSVPIIEDWISDSEDESETKTPQNTTIPKSTSTGKRKNRKACFVCKSLDHLIKAYDYHDKKMAQTTSRNHAKRGTHKQYAQMSLLNPHRHVVPATVLTQSKLVPITVVRPVTTAVPKPTGNPQYALKEKRVIDSGCSRHMIENMSYLSDFKELNGGYVAFGGNPKGGKISRKGKIKTGKLDFDDVYFVKELKLNLFSVSQMCDKKNSVLFTDTECLILSPEFKLPDENQVLLRVPRENNMYNVDLKNIVLSGDLTCLLEKATLDESNLWHRRLGHINFKTINKLVKGNLVRGLPSKVFETDNTCVACKKGKKHRASCKTKPISYVDQPIYRLHIDLFGPTLVKILNKKSYFLVVTDDIVGSLGCFFWPLRMRLVPFLRYLSLAKKTNLVSRIKGIKREFSIPSTSQQNGIAERKNMTLIEAARTMLADSLLPIPFWAEAVNTACYVQNRVLVTKPHNKTPYELLHGRTLSIGFMRPFGCHVTILNTLDSLGKFDRKLDEGFLVRYSVSSKAFRVFNSRARIVQETLHVNFLENKPNVTSSGPTWLFDIDNLTKTMNYQSVTAGNQSNPSAGIQEQFDAEKAGEENVQQYVLFLVWSSGSTNSHNTDGDDTFDEKEHEFEGRKPESEVNASLNSSAQSKKHDDKTMREANGKCPVKSLTGYRNLSAEFEDFSDNSINENNTAGTLVHAVSMPELEDITYSDDDEDVGAEADFNNLEKTITVSPIPTTRIHKDHHEEVYVCQPLGFEDLNYPDKVYKVVKALYGLHQAPRAWYETLANYLLENGFQRGKIDQTLFIQRQKGELTFFLGLQVKQKRDRIFISQDKYVAKILRKFRLTDRKLASTPIDTEKPLLKDPDGEDVDVDTYRSMIGSLMYLTSSRPDIMFAKQIVVATSSTKAEYVAAASCCAQVLWI